MDREASRVGVAKLQSGEKREIETAHRAEMSSGFYMELKLLSRGCSGGRGVMTSAITLPCVHCR